jgi:glycosyltransferase involved in cell wall biosynthesis
MTGPAATAVGAGLGRLRIALVAPLVTTIAEPQQGGSQVFVADLAVGMTERGHAVDVYAASGSALPGARVIETHVDPTDLADALVQPGRPRRHVAALDEAYARVFAMVAEGGYDVVHSHGFDPAALRHGRVGRSPVIHTIHLPPEPEAAAALREARRSDEPPVVVGVSAAQARAWSSFARFDRVIRIGVPVERIPWSLRAGRGLVFAGRFSPDKGAAEAVEIARLADEPIDLYGSAYDAAYARDLHARYDGDPSVTFHEPLPRAALWRRFAGAHAVLCPTNADESFGLVAAEAQAAGTPVVAFARGALVEVVQDGVTGALVPAGDVRAAAAAIATIESIDRERCREHAVADLGLDACLTGYEALYAEVAADRRRPQSPQRRRPSASLAAGG